MARSAAALALVFFALPFTFAAGATSLQLKVGTADPTCTAGDDIVLNVTLSTVQDDTYEFDLGIFPQDFGIYILGPWGPIQPDPKWKWMEQEHDQAARIRVAKDKPYRTTLHLSEFFNTAELKPGKYQICLKFFDSSLKMINPLDSDILKLALTDKASVGHLANPPHELPSFVKLEVKGKLEGYSVKVANLNFPERSFTVGLIRTEDKRRDLDEHIASLNGKIVVAKGYMDDVDGKDGRSIRLEAFGDFQIEEAKEDKQPAAK